MNRFIKTFCIPLYIFFLLIPYGCSRENPPNLQAPSTLPSIIPSNLPSITASVTPSTNPSVTPSTSTTLPVTDIHALTDSVYTVKTELVWSVAPPSPCNSVQGCCVVGDTVLFAAQYVLPSGEERTRILGYDFFGNKVAESDLLSLEHANDFAYNANDHTILVAHCQPTYNRYSVLNADSLQVLYSGTLPYHFASIAYCPVTDAYVSVQGAGEYLDLWTGDKTHLLRKAQTVPTSITQGLYVDTQGVYHTRYNPNEILVFDRGLNYKRKIYLQFDYPSCEPESLFIYEDETYVLCNVWGTAYLFRLTSFTPIG
ncbi:MAG: hypothetical protein IKC56_05165 [Clostridia bacterium]|nr:hypothetical protein [Clostridia bacterium]